LDPGQIKNQLFSINNEDSFIRISLEVFNYQAKHNAVYREYIERLHIKPDNVLQLNQIPFLPVEFFKTHKVSTTVNEIEIQFESSGTTSSVQSKHYVHSLNLYEQSFINAFRKFYGAPEEYVFLALLPSYLERSGSSLVYMADKLIGLSKKSDSGFYLHNLNELLKKITELEKAGQKYILLGVTYALLDLAEEAAKLKLPALKHATVMETGGMKGKRKELVKEELHAILKKSFGISTVHSEYGMTELLSQAYSKGDGLFSCPPWMRILIRDTNDPFRFVDQHKTGGINIIDLANIYSCSFIATQDLGKLHSQNIFEVLGRFDNSDLRGCNLLLG